MNSEDNPLYALWGRSEDDEIFMIFFIEPPKIEVAAPAEVDLNPVVAQRLNYWKWRQAHGQGEHDIEYRERY